MNYWYEKDSINIIEALKSSLYGGIIFGDDTFIPPLWTLKIEFLGSIFLIFYLILTFKKNQKYTLPLFFLILALVFKNEAIYYFLFVGGAFLKNVPNIRRFFYYILILISFYLISFQDGFYYQLLANNLPTNFSLRNISHGLGSLILVYLIRLGFINKFLKSQFNLFLGKISYSLYLIHHLILCSVISIFFIAMEQSSNSLILLYLFYVISTFFISYFIINKFDEYGIKLSKKISYKILEFIKPNLF